MAANVTGNGDEVIPFMVLYQLKGVFLIHGQHLHEVVTAMVFYELKGGFLVYIQYP